MEKRIIRLGDPTSHGGVVVSAAADVFTHGKPVARMGDHVTCPIKGHAGCVIVEGDPTDLIDGVPIALEGHMTSCGATLISTLDAVVVSQKGGGVPEAAAASRAAYQDSASGRPGDPYRPEAHRYDEQLQLVALPIAGVPYFIETADGRVFSGRTGADGLLPRIGTTRETDYTVLWGDEALARQAK